MKHKAHRLANRVLAVACALMLTALAFAQGSGAEAHEFNFRAIVYGISNGFLTAFLVDLNAWSKSKATDSFDWKLAFKRWLAGAVTGVTTAIGWDVMVKF